MFKLCLVLLLCYSSFALVMYDTRFGNESIAQSVVNAMNTSVDPCEDFYEYACGSWLKNTTIPEDAARYSRSFDVINKKNFAILRDILENDHSIDSSLRKFFGSCMDMHNIEVEGTSVLDTYLSFIDSMVENPATGSWNNAWKLIGFMHSIRMYPLFEFHVEIDAKIPTQYLATFGQSGITLPDRNFYLDPNLSGLRDQYKAHMVRMFTMLNMTNPSGRADSILQFETSLATIFVPGADLRDPFKVYNKMSLNELRDTAPGVNWDNYLKGATLESTSTFNLIAPQYMQKLSDLVAQVSLEQVGFYLKWVFIHEVADYLPARFVNETFSFFGKVLLGEDEMPIRTTTCIESTDESMGFLLSQYFVQRAFPGASKTMASNLIHAIEDVFSTTLKGDDWMDETTRQRALTKLSLVKDMIGYPDVWPIYSFSVADSYIRNKMAARLDAFSKQKDKLGKPVSHDEWEMTPATVNAYYEPTMNVMVFPAAILQNPFFDLQFPIPMNFGGIGMVMGHELSHGFDDQGRLYDGYGKLENWWTPTVNENFKVKATCLVNQYSAYQPLPGYHVNGNLTLGENIADNAGIKDAYKALEATLGPDALNAPSIVSFLTNAKLFFVSYAQTWCSKARDEFIKQRLLTDVHSPAKFRVIGPLSNLKQFASTFNCKVGSAMNPTNKCELF